MSSVRPEITDIVFQLYFSFISIVRAQ